MKGEAFFRSTFTSDISANMFAAFFLFLVSALSGGGLDRGDHRRAVSEDARKAFHVIERNPLEPRQMVELLYSRRPSSGGVSADIFDDRVEVGGADGRTRSFSAKEISDGGLGLALPQRLAGNQAEPVRLYIFGHGAYRAVTEALEKRGLSWRELTVPRALCDPNGGGWSAAFRALSGTSDGLEAFRAGLTKLLAAHGRDDWRWPMASGAARGDQAFGSFVYKNYLFDLWDAFEASFWTFANAAGVFLCIGLVAWIEFRQRRPR